MNVTIELPGGGLDLKVTASPDATVGDLVTALQADGAVPTTGSVVLVNGRPAPADHSLAEVGLRDGGVVRIAAPESGGRAVAVPDAGGVPVGVTLVVSGGLDAGRRLALAPGRHRLGRGPDAVVADPTLQDRHATLEVQVSGRVQVADHGTRGGTWLDGRPVGRSAALAPGTLLRAGALAVRVEDGEADDRPRGDVTTFNRPPRPAPPPTPSTITAPPEPREDGKRPTLPLASVAGGLAMGAVMWAMTGTATYAVLAFLMPVLGVATALAARRRHGRDGRLRRREHLRALRRFADEVAAASTVFTARQRLVHPDLGEIVRRATGPSTRLWERRPDHPDAWHLVVGHATTRWKPPVAGPTGGQPAAEVDEIVRHEAWLRDTPVVAPGGVIGVVGDRRAALAVARGMVAQACVHHGPADLQAVLVTPDELAWDGAKWLPHLRDDRTGRPRTAGPVEGRELLAGLLARPGARRGAGGSDQEADDRVARLVILDGVQTCEGRDAPGRAVLRGEAGPVLGIVLAPSVDRLPASCDTVVVLEGADGAARVVRPAAGDVVRGVLVSGMSERTLSVVGRALAGLDDPEAAGDRDLPGTIALPDVFAAAGSPVPTSADAVRELWRRQRDHGRLRTPIGVAAEGPLVLDLGMDGPHGLVAGTTGAGKSELLRTLVAGLAAGADPDHVAFVLVDYKGGAAFDRCRDLPHVVGLVTDLDDDLAERALTCLRAELHHRERLLRSAGVGDLDGWRRTPRAANEPLPDLVVVIDEFATLAAELPDFLDSLVGIAQRGRSLGVHLVLATQRPAGVVSDDIRANTNLRIALRVQDRQDSVDVIEDSRAAAIGRDQPGRAVVRLGPDSLVGMQSALVTGTARRGSGPVAVEPFALIAGHSDVVEARTAHQPDESDLDRMVAAVLEAFDLDGLRRPRQPWPPALPDRIDLDDLADLVDAPEPGLALALVDDPANQRRHVGGWDPDDGSLLLVGTLGSGTTSALGTVAVAAARRWAPTELHVHVIDAGRGDLAPLAGLPHVSSVVRLGEAERLARLVGRLAAEVDRRRLSPEAASGPRVLLVMDDWEAFATAHDVGPAASLLDELMRVIVEGPGVGVVTALAVGRPGGIGSRVLASFGRRWVLRLPDDADAAGLGVRGTSRLPAGRAVDAATGRHLQIGHVPDLAATVGALSAGCDGGGGPAPIEVLPARAWLGDLPALDVSAPAWTIPVGVRGDDLGPGLLALHAGDHALVAGPARSGRTSLLTTLAASAVAAGVEVVACCPRGGALARAAGVEVVDADRLPTVLATPGPRLVLVDDAETIETPGIEHALADPAADVRLVAAARSDVVRGSYGHWLRTVARSRTGVLLGPDLDLDGDLLGVRLPRRPLAPPAVGRGFLVVDGACVQVQAAAVDATGGGRTGRLRPAA